LMEAICAVHDDAKLLGPKKMADSIRKEVNSRLTGAGFPKVSSDVIYRRLKKFPRSSRPHVEIPRS
jgi:hypothetical protein